MNPGVLAEDLFHGRSVTQICLHERNGSSGDLLHPVNGLGAGVDKVVCYDDFIPGLDEFHAGVASDVTCATADEN